MYFDSVFNCIWIFRHSTSSGLFFFSQYMIYHIQHHSYKINYSMLLHRLFCRRKTVIINIDHFYINTKTKRRRSDSVLWQKPLHQQKCQQGKVATQKTPQKISIKKAIAGRHRTVSWSNYSQPVGVVNRFTKLWLDYADTITPLSQCQGIFRIIWFIIVAHILLNVSFVIRLYLSVILYYVQTCDW